MTTPKPKQVEGAIQEINPTSVVLAGKTIYLHPNTRALFNSQNYKVGEVIRLRYDRDGNYIDSERLPREAHQIAIGSGSETHTALEPEHPELYIQQEMAMGPKDREKAATTEIVNPPKIENVHIQKTSTAAVPVQQPHWMTEREKNDTIVLQSLLARSVEILDGIYRDHPEFIVRSRIHEKSDFEDTLLNRCENIEYITDRLYTYVKKKVFTQKTIDENDEK